ncbi:hypothetical protein EV361DRAFT_290623 [Lentinula raphanica]|nr:hypothetical protein F5880DRAFT_1563132 [Lentinula raphanica]KAJ3970348.1 hypothetical protein EV361DRAFT_290623 [Lentinula raphanica]
MRLTSVLLLGLVSATYGLPNPGLKHFQPRSSPSSDVAVGNDELNSMSHSGLVAHPASNAGPAEDRVSAEHPGELVATYHISKRRTLPKDRDMINRQAWAEYIAWSIALIENKLFKRGMKIKARYDGDTVYIHAPRRFKIQLTTEAAVVVINKSTREGAEMMSLADAKGLPQDKYWLVPTPVAMMLSIQDLELRVIFCKDTGSGRREDGAWFSIHLNDDDRNENEKMASLFERSYPPFSKG